MNAIFFPQLTILGACDEVNEVPRRANIIPVTYALHHPIPRHGLASALVNLGREEGSKDFYGAC